MSERNREIIARFDAGQTLQQIGDDYGITRERVRQIVVKSGHVPRRITVGEKRDAIAEQCRKLADAGCTYEQIVAETGKNYRYVTQLCRERSIEVDRISLSERLELLRLMAKVSNGASIRSLVGDGYPAQRLAHFCEQYGISSKHGPNRDLSARRQLVEEGRTNRKSWRQIAAEVGKIEGKEVSATALAMWARPHGLVFRGPDGKVIRGREDRPRRVVSLTPAIQCDGSSIRETCIRLRGTYSAGQIARSLGITRNAVIGHWWRAKNGPRRTLAENRVGQ